MTFIRTIPEHEARGELAELYRRLAYRDGTVDEAFKALSLHPVLLAADAAMYDAIMYAESPLSRAERELLAITVSGLNGCNRCLQHHSARLEKLQRTGGPRGTHRATEAQSAERARALVDLAEKLTREPTCVAVTDIERLRQVGLDDRAILDACNVIAYFNYSNRVTLGLGIDAAPTTSSERPGNEPH
jgi:uncharacterized peroxidase-related enzyme